MVFRVLTYDVICLIWLCFFYESCIKMLADLLFTEFFYCVLGLLLIKLCLGQGLI